MEAKIPSVVKIDAVKWADAISRIRIRSRPGHWTFIAFSTLALVIIQIIYYWLDEQVISDLEELNLLIGLTLQVVVGILIAQGNWSAASASTSQPLKTRQLLKQHLVNIRNLGEIRDVFLSLEHNIVPIVGATFIKYDQKSGRNELVDEWSMDGRPLPIPAPIPTLNESSIDFNERGPALGVFIPGKSSAHKQAAEKLSIFCLPRPYGDSQIALLSLYFPPDASFSPSQFALLNDLAMEIELAIERAQMKRLLSSQELANKVEPDQIARYLHDSLGHNLAYLRLKLDQFSEDGAFQDIVAIHQEIERMRDIADQAYEQMRNSLSDLRGEPVPEFSAAIQDYAGAAADRAGFELCLQIEGTSRTLPVKLQRQILYILREVLRNIEKHAHASKVWIRQLWEADDLVLLIEDDGRGFDVVAARNQPGHFGLKIIEESTRELHGRFALVSEVNAGTKVELYFPVDQNVYILEGNP